MNISRTNDNSQKCVSESLSMSSVNTNIEDVALSLVSLGRINFPDVQPRSRLPDDTVTASDASTSSEVDAPHRKAFVYKLPPNIKHKIESASRSSNVAVAKSSKTKSRESKRETNIPFEEMQRLMRVYGPIKCLRRRAPKAYPVELKPDSVKRKFYRWFPDFEKRFEKTAEGWYRPIFGHEEEMNYRKEMRILDQEALVMKRNKKRTAVKANIDL